MDNGNKRVRERKREIPRMESTQNKYNNDIDRHRVHYAVFRMVDFLYKFKQQF